MARDPDDGRSGRRSGASTRDGPGSGGGRAATRERCGSARAEEFRRCRTSRSDDGCAALTGGTAASSKLNSRSPADAVLEGTKRSEYTVSFFPLDPGGFASGADIVYDARARTEARSGRAEHVRTPRLPAVANSEEAPYPTFRRFPCVSAPHASPRRSRARRCRARFASRCPIRARVPTTSRTSRCGLLRASSLVGTVSSGQNLVVARPSGPPRCEKKNGEASVFVALAVSLSSGAQSDKQGNTYRSQIPPYAFPVTQKRASSGKRRRIFPRQTRQLRGNPKFFAVCFRVRRLCTQRSRARFFGRSFTFRFFFAHGDISHFKTSALRRGGDPRVACIYIQQPRQHSTGSIRQQRTHFNSSNSATERSANNR